MTETTEKVLDPEIAEKLKSLNFQAKTIIENRYACGRIIGRGGAGTVYEGLQIAVNRKVAVKVMSPKSLDNEYRARFDREAVVIASLNHPNCITIYDYGYDKENDVVYMVMEFVDGTMLRRRMHQKTLSINEVVDVCIAITAAIEHAHEAGVLHRDLKPENILVDQNFVPKVLDFGLAAIAGSPQDGDQRLTRQGAVFGTPPYMSPEQCRGIGVDERSDLYTIGVIIFELLTGRLPFESDIVFNILMMHTNDEAPKINSSTVPVRLAEIVDKLLAKDPDDRFQSATELRFALQDVKDAESLEYGFTEISDSAEFVPPLRDRISTNNSLAPKSSDSGARKPESFSDIIGDSEEKPKTKRVKTLEELGAKKKQKSLPTLDDVALFDELQKAAETHQTKLGIGAEDSDRSVAAKMSHMEVDEGDREGIDTESGLPKTHDSEEIVAKKIDTLDEMPPPPPEPVKRKIPPPNKPIVGESVVAKGKATQAPTSKIDTLDELPASSKSDPIESEPLESEPIKSASDDGDVQSDPADRRNLIIGGLIVLVALLAIGIWSANNASDEKEPITEPKDNLVENSTTKEKAEVVAPDNTQVEVKTEEPDPKKIENSNSTDETVGEEQTTDANEKKSEDMIKNTGNETPNVKTEKAPTKTTEKKTEKTEKTAKTTKTSKDTKTTDTKKKDEEEKIPTIKFSY